MLKQLLESESVIRISSVCHNFSLTYFFLILKNFNNNYIVKLIEFVASLKLSMIGTFYVTWILLLHFPKPVCDIKQDWDTQYSVVDN